MEKTGESLAIVTGASGSLGESYLKAFAEDSSIRSVGLARSHLRSTVDDVEYITGLDLLNQDDLRSVIEDIGCREAMRVLLVHPVGKFLFEEFPSPDGSIDQGVLDANFTTLQNTLNAISSQLRTDARLVVCGFGSISDKHNVPYWKSYTAAKNRVRGLLTELRGNLKQSRARGNAVMANISTTDTAHMRDLRPNADTTHWLHPDTVVEATMPHILNGDAPAYVELDIYKPKPGFDPAAYFADHAGILEREKRSRS